MYRRYRNAVVGGGNCNSCIELYILHTSAKQIQKTLLLSCLRLAESTASLEKIDQEMRFLIPIGGEQIERRLVDGRRSVPQSFFYHP
jgi:hypothetical protein